MSASSFEEAFHRAVKPGPGRLLPGVSLAAASANENVPDFVASYGTLKVVPSPAVSSKTVMWIASCTKLATTIAALQCVERGLFSLESTADVERLLPEWANPQVLSFKEEDTGSPILTPAKERITLRRLLNHTSGLTYDFMPPLLQWRMSRGEEWQSMRSPIAECFTHPLIFEPGAGFAYGPGLDVAGLMVARANKCDFETYLRRNIFDVLGMHDTSFHVSHNNIGDRLMPVTSRPSPNEPLVNSDGTNPILRQPVDAKDDFGGAGLFGTAEDYIKLLKSILRDDGKLLTSQTVQRMFTPSLEGNAEISLHNCLSIPNLATLMIPGEPAVGSPDAGTWNHGLGGLIGLHESEDGFKPGWLQWVGGPNLKWWIDRGSGTCGIFATQLFPPGEVNSVHLSKMFQKEMVERLGKKAD
ncbi:beta-lactamase [Dothidotthia symphoricarpi CBS 119687]|uniref:Beta-lactamase n=1 Tax=Dothidotthia symphoricarpi CBS 119687 TaxID=1392245 RepID=A0A6A6AQ66_9PLEO|nr:beta-lactamase [Dothidotthia symphoricarpi CBS 119687]KAF2133094.1 beta-lactamase [Dothidotthia symphoricarpi CBS 119687]